MLEHTIRLHTHKTIYLICHFYILSPRTVYIKLSNFILFSLENDDIRSSKCCVQLFLLVFIIRCLLCVNLHFMKVRVFIRNWRSEDSLAKFCLFPESQSFALS